MRSINLSENEVIPYGVSGLTEVRDKCGAYLKEREPKMNINGVFNKPRGWDKDFDKKLFDCEVTAGLRRMKGK